MKRWPSARHVWRYFFIALLLLNSGFSSSAYAEGSRLVPIEQLRATPQRFDGQRVRVVGYLQLEVDEDVLYPTREDFNNSVTEHALRLTLTDAQLRSSSKLNHGHVLVEGVFRVKDGHDGTPRGWLQSVTRLQMWRKPRK